MMTGMPARYMIAGIPVKIPPVKFSLATAIDIATHPLTRQVTVRHADGREFSPIPAYRDGVAQFAKTHFVPMGGVAINPRAVLYAGRPTGSKGRLSLITSSGTWLTYPRGMGTGHPVERLAKAAGLRQIAELGFARIDAAESLMSGGLAFGMRTAYIRKAFQPEIIAGVDEHWIECLDTNYPYWINPRFIASLGHASFTTAKGEVVSLRILSGKMRVRLQNSVRWVPVSPHLSVNPAQIARIGGGIAYFRTKLTSVEVSGDVAPLLRRLAARAAKAI